jgi:hypothetical protein
MCRDRQTYKDSPKTSIVLYYSTTLVLLFYYSTVIYILLYYLLVSKIVGQLQGDRGSACKLKSRAKTQSRA